MYRGDPLGLALWAVDQKSWAIRPDGPAPIRMAVGLVSVRVRTAGADASSDVQRPSAHPSPALGAAGDVNPAVGVQQVSPPHASQPSWTAAAAMTKP
ncbi:hypothetical protein Vau01_106670 [Virgisporangium aurantiacum]|uniref:Uncharacterized protein n=1 Tax=Virgisporangium aurantiacum TaxID=175570 RepID=A0A8J3ZFX6_9ACTN|nr:hypothetical protein Vau01_106670 [Virgisporangium aurantiacum]